MHKLASIAALSLSTSLLMACGGTMPPKTTTTAGQLDTAPEIKVTMPELARPSAASADPRRAIADKGSFEALVAWMPNDANAVMVCAKKTTAPMDRLLQPLQEVLPSELLSLATGVHTLPSSFRGVAGDGADDGLVLVRTEGTDAQSKKTGVFFAPKGTKSLVKTGRKVSGLATKDNTIMNMESWTEVALDDAHVAMVPRDRVEGFALAVSGRKTGQPVALKGTEPQLTPTLVAEAWVVPTAAGSMEGFGVAFADLRLDETTAGDLAMHVVLTAALGDQEKLAKALKAAVQKADGVAAADYRKARVATGDNNTVTLDVAFARTSH
jgi:hypothetical protein